jgi:hypothetical protein
VVILAAVVVVLEHPLVEALAELVQFELFGELMFHFLVQM